MTVTGTQQRVYGTLVADNCNINIRRFAIVMDDMDKSPKQSSNVVYANAVPMTQTGYLYNGYITLFMLQDTGNVYAAIEVRICKTDQKTIIIDSYGEIELPASEIYEGVSLWFDKNNTKYFASQDDFPETGSITVTYVDGSTGHSYIWTGASYTAGNGWTKLNDAMYGSKMSHFKTTFDKFKEDGKTGLTTINCCKNCPDECKNVCTISVTSFSYTYVSCIPGLEKIKLDTRIEFTNDARYRYIPYGLRYDGYRTIHLLAYDVFIEYEIGFDKEKSDFYLKFWIYSRTNVTSLRYVDLFINIPIYRTIDNLYGYDLLMLSKWFRISGFVSDFNEYEEITSPVIYNGTVQYSQRVPPINPDYTTLIGKTIKIVNRDIWNPVTYQYAEIIDIDENHIAYIDPKTIYSSNVQYSHEIRPVIDGDFELTESQDPSIGFITIFTVIYTNIPLADIGIDLTMDISLNNGARLHTWYPVFWSINKDTVINQLYEDIMDPFTNITENPDGTYTVRWEGQLTKEALKYKNYSSLSVETYSYTICIRTDKTCNATISGNIRWYRSTGGDIHYGDKGLVITYQDCPYYAQYQEYPEILL